MLKLYKNFKFNNIKTLNTNISLTTIRCYNNKYQSQNLSTSSASSIDNLPDLNDTDNFDETVNKNKTYVTKPLKDVINTVSLHNTTKRSAEISSKENDIDWTISFKGLSSEPFSEEACKILQEPLVKTDIEIKPDGILYLPEIKYRRILNKAFGPGAWGLVPRSEAVIINSNIVTRDYALIILGRLVSLCSGEQTFFGDDQIITSLEGCKSNALMRCCKDLGIASELWDPIFINSFKSKYCKAQVVEHMKTKSKKRVWMKNTDNTPPYPFKLCK